MQNYHKKTIEQLYFTAMRNHPNRDESGALQYVQKPYRAAYIPEVITGWSRFGHHIIDQIILSISSFVIGAIAGIAMASGGTGMFAYRNGHWAFNFLGLFVSFGFYFFFEMLTSSTPGKLILGRVVINEYAEKPDVVKIALRTLSRMVPFEAFSCLGDRGWHDTWTKTYVVSRDEAAKLYAMRIQQEQEGVNEMSQDYLRRQERQSGFQPPISPQ
jgi:uncharacterized RDD family membrane protein YckC